MSDIAIKISHISKIYKIFAKPSDRVKEALHPFGKRFSRDFYALNDIDLDIKKGEILGIIGKNGAGKSTLLKIITGVLTPSQGEINVDGKIASLLELGAGFNPEMTGIENIYLNGSIMGYSQEEMEAKVPDIVKFADIGDFINQPVKMYSSGMFARLAFAVNVNVDPDILIVDEALSVGDVFFQNKCLKRMEELKDKGITILFVSHDMGSIRMLCNKCLWITDGTMKMYGDVQTVSEAYFNEQLTQHNAMRQLEVEHMETTEKVEVIKDNSKLVVPVLRESQGLRSDYVHIKTIYFENNGEITKLLYPDKEYSVTMVVEFEKDLENLIFGFVVENQKGIGLLAFNTFMSSDEKSVSAKAGKAMCVTFRFTLPRLASGSYIISPAVAQGTIKKHVQLTWLENVDNIEIINEGYNASLLEVPSTCSIISRKPEDITYQ